MIPFVSCHQNYIKKQGTFQAQEANTDFSQNLALKTNRL